MRPEEILKKLSGFKTDEERVKFLKELLNDVKDKKIRIFLESIIKQLSQKKKSEEKPRTIEEILMDAAQGTSAIIEAGEIEFGKYIGPVREARFEVGEEGGPEPSSPVPYIPATGNEAEMRGLLEEREQLLRDYERGSSEEILARAETMTQEIRRPTATRQSARQEVFLPKHIGGEYKRAEERHREDIFSAATEFTKDLRSGSGDEVLKKKRLYLPKEDGY